MTVVLSAHLLDLVQTICDRVALFSNGKVGLIGRVDDLMRDVLGGSYVLDIEADGDQAADRLRGVGNVRRVVAVSPGRFRVDAAADVRSRIAKALAQSGAELKSLSIAHASLEDVYTRHLQEVRDAA